MGMDRKGLGTKWIFTSPFTVSGNCNSLENAMKSVSSLKKQMKTKMKKRERDEGSKKRRKEGREKTGTLKSGDMHGVVHQKPRFKIRCWWSKSRGTNESLMGWALKKSGTRIQELDYTGQMG